MKKTIIISALALAGCGKSAIEKAENEYRVAEKAIIDPLGKKCVAANKAAAAFAADGDQVSYEHWELTAYNDCSEADRQ